MSPQPPVNPKHGGGPLLVVLSGPSGVGKDAAIGALRALDRPWHFIVTATTRPKRPNERDGIDYVFLGADGFQVLRDKGDFLECAEVYGNWYGVPKQQVRSAKERGLDTMVKVDVQGAATIKGLVPDAVFIFLVAPTMEELQQRLRIRATESALDLELRTGIAQREMQHLSSFDYVVVNRDGCLDEAVACIDAIVTAEKCRVQPRSISL